jgi:hypothetical protein
MQFVDDGKGDARFHVQWSVERRVRNVANTRNRIRKVVPAAAGLRDHCRPGEATGNSCQSITIFSQRQ